MKAKVKICGIRDCEEAIICVDAGADFFGFNFIENSKRFIKPKDALKIIKMLPLRVKKVGVFRNESMERVNSLIKYLKLDFVQLHGDESPNYVSKINIVGKIKVFSLGKNFDVKDILNQVERYNTDYILVDRERQGEGELLSFKKVKELKIGKKLFLAGGLNAENVRIGIEEVHPYAVDVAGGVETDRVKNKEKIYRFIREVKKYDF